MVSGLRLALILPAGPSHRMIRYREHVRLMRGARAELIGRVRAAPSAVSRSATLLLLVPAAK